MHPDCSHLPWAGRLLLAVALAAGCEGATTPAPDPHENADATCQPIAEHGCFLPFPSSFYEKTDPSSPTGVRVAIPGGVLPKNQVGQDYDPARLNVLDGYSPATQIIAGFGPSVRVDPRTIPGVVDNTGSGYAASLLGSSGVQLIDYATGERVPLFAEVDANVPVTDTTSEQVLLIHPALRLAPSHRYVVALVHLRDTSGNPIVVHPFQALVSGSVPAGSRLAGLQSTYADLFAAVERAGVSRADLTLAWDFHTASDVQAHGHVLAMRDAAFARWQKDDLGYTVTQVTDTPDDPNLLRAVYGTFAVPSFLTSNTDLYAGLQLDANNRPVDSGTNYDAKLVINVPQCAKTATRPLPIIVFGHGLFGSATQIITAQQEWTAEQLCMVEVATDWVGLSDYDMTSVVARVFSNFDEFYEPTDRLQQAQVDFLVLARLAAGKLKDMPALQYNGAPIVDGRELYYFGISQGGIEGNTFLALSPDVQRGALNVGAGVYSFMLTRSGDFAAFKGIMDYTYPAQSDQQLLLALSQSYWDYTDPISYVGHTLADPLPDENGQPMTGKHILQQEGKDDAEVPNLATRVLVRTAALPQLESPVEAVWGLTTKKGPLDSAYTQWDVSAMPVPPPGNVPAPDGNDAHDGIGKLPDLIAQLKMFFTPTGQIVETCKGPCTYAAAPTSP